MDRQCSLQAILLWEGLLTNRRLRDLFSVSSPRASQLLVEFRDANPRWLKWDNRLKGYKATKEAYAAVKSGDTLDVYLSLLGGPKLLTHPGNPKPQTLWRAFPEISHVEPSIFAKLQQAIWNREITEIIYQSMSTPTPHKRRISPRALVLAGRRWHVRAYCHERMAFRDFSLGRISTAKNIDECQPTSICDYGWDTLVPVKLEPHPALSEQQREVIMLEYFSGTAARTDTCRACLVPYFLQEIRAAIDPAKQFPPEYQIILSNPSEVEKWLF